MLACRHKKVHSVLNSQFCKTVACDLWREISQISLLTPDAKKVDNKINITMCKEDRKE